MAGQSPAAKALALASALLAAGPVLAQTLPGDQLTHRRTVQAGVKTQVWTTWALTPDCQVIRGFNVQIVRTPQHGVASLEKVQQVIDRSWLNHAVSPQRLAIVRQCMGSEVTTIGIFYTAQSPPPGQDSFSVIITNAQQSRQRALEILVSVR